MSRRILKDIEEAIQREVRRISFSEDRTKDNTVLEEVFDPFTGNIISVPIQAKFYDSGADAHHIQYPHIFVKVLKTGEDKTSNRIVPPYGQDNFCNFNQNAPKAFKTLFQNNDGIISVAGNIFKTNSFKIALAQTGHLLRILTGVHKGTYTIASINKLVPGPHEITVSNILINNMSAGFFEASTRKLYFEGIDFSTVKVGDNYLDSLNASFPITAIDSTKSIITLGGTGSPSASTGKVQRPGNVFNSAVLVGIPFLVLDPTQPIIKQGAEATTSTTGVSPQIPIDIYYLVRVDSKERASHIEILNRVWEEFNPPRTGLPVIVRTKNSAEQLLTQDVTTGGSTTINVGKNTDFVIGDKVFIYDDFTPSKSNYGFENVFTANVVGKVSTNQIIISTPASDIFKVSKGAKIVSNAYYKLLMFHFVDHVTKDIESAQYWVHEFTFWVQGWIDRLETPAEYDEVVLDISTPIDDLDNNNIISDR